MKKILFSARALDNEVVYGFYVYSRSRHYILQEYNEQGGYDERWETSDWIEIQPSSLIIESIDTDVTIAGK